MKKLFKKLFSRSILVVLALLLELFLILVLYQTVTLIFEVRGIDPASTYWDEIIYVAIRLIEYTICLIIFFKIIVKPEDPEFKIPWIVVMLLLPVFGAFTFLIFGNHGLRKRDRIIVDASATACQDHFEVEKQEYKKLHKDLGSATGVFHYLHSTSGLAPHSGNKVTYYKNGETFFPELLNCLKQAKDFIFIEFFIIGEGQEWSSVLEILKQKASEGVEIKIVYDDLGCCGVLPNKTPKVLKKLGIDCYKFHPLRPILSGVYNNRDHRKIVVIDHKYGFTGGINLADEYANITHPFKYWKDTMIKIEGSAINNLIATFLKNYDLCTLKVSNYNKYLKYEYPVYNEEGYVMPFGDGPGEVDNYLIGEQNYINIINYAKKTLFISSPYLIPTFSLIDALRNAALRGVDVRLIIPGTPDKKMVYWMAETHLPYLLSAGVKIYRYTPGFNHMKAAIADDELGFVGTINLDFRSLVHHFECGATLYKNPCLVDIRKDFDEMLSQSEEVPSNFRVRGIKRPICSLIKLFTPLL